VLNRALVLRLAGCFVLFCWCRVGTRDWVVGIGKKSLLVFFPEDTEAFESY